MPFTHHKNATPSVKRRAATLIFRLIAVVAVAGVTGACGFAAGGTNVSSAPVNQAFVANSQQPVGKAPATVAALSGHGNDPALQAIPEPSTWAMVLGGLGLMAGYQRKRSRNA